MLGIERKYQICTTGTAKVTKKPSRKPKAAAVGGGGRPVDPPFTDLDKMLSIAKPEIISVCVWHLLHDKITIQAANSPFVKGIICEKPMAIGTSKAKSMVDACEKNNNRAGGRKRKTTENL